MAYEIFERQAVRVEEPTLTVAPLPDARISLNAAASRLLKNAGVKAVKILWDMGACRLALQATRKNDLNSYSVVFGRGGRQSTVSGKAFLNIIKRMKLISRDNWEIQKVRTNPIRNFMILEHGCAKVKRALANDSKLHLRILIA